MNVLQPQALRGRMRGAERYYQSGSTLFGQSPIFDCMERIADHLDICALYLRLGSISLVQGLWSVSRRGELVTYSWVGGGTHEWGIRPTHEWVTSTTYGGSYFGDALGLGRSGWSEGRRACCS